MNVSFKANFFLVPTQFFSIFSSCLKKLFRGDKNDLSEVQYACNLKSIEWLNEAFGLLLIHKKVFSEKKNLNIIVILCFS